MPPSASSLFQAPGRPQALRVFMIFALIVVLQIPVLFMSFLVQERRSRRDAAGQEIASKWGNAQTLIGPALVVPWEQRWTDTNAQGQRVERREWRRLVLLPESLHVRAHVASETRRRGIYGVPVYRLDAQIGGRFGRPDFAKLGVDSTSVDWPRAVLAVGVSDPRAIQQQTSVTWDGRRVELQPGAADFREVSSGVHAELALAAPPWGASFTLPLALNGTNGFYLAPFGKQTEAEVSGDWSHPSFQGGWLPTERSVADSGFRARWSIPSLGRNYPQAWVDRTPREGERGVAQEIQSSTFGLDLGSSVDAYRLCDRTVKYAALFFILTFTSFWLLEVLGSRPLHPIQYGLVGGALCVFVLLELSMSEHIGFGASYAIAATAVVALIVAYAASALGSVGRALVVGAALAMLYGFHYVVLRNEDYALLLGSLLLFGVLAAVMMLTRRVSWYGAPPGAAGGPAH